uniref:Y-family DNA polymerase n=1 Tax=Petrachloros mirabilis TaxID=2918835 RepID=UPI001EE96B64|nr:Y-family DNA polymerase [Petrachloros mirabilis]
MYGFPLESRIFALCDCNSFYASCEQVFAPGLSGQPVVVLSNNDGCVVARSTAAKGLGIGMGVPYFQIRDLVQEHQVKVFSSNYELYGDMSQRVMEILSQFAPAVETYSIDEAFLDFSGWRWEQSEALGHQLRQIVKQWTGIPVSIGIAPTKTLAKVANRVAKGSTGGVYALKEEAIAQLLATLSVDEVWGIGRHHAKSLQAQGVTTALELQQVQPQWVRQKYNVVMERLVWELRGVSCLPLELSPGSRHSITVSRSFGRPVTTCAELGAAIATYTSRAAEKLRQQQLSAGAMQVFVSTGRFATPCYRQSQTVTLPSATNHTATLIQQSLAATQRLYRPGYAFKKAGVILLDLVAAAKPQLSLLHPETGGRSEALMSVMDAINRRYGAGTLQYAVCGKPSGWQTKSEQRSPCYTTQWSQLPVVLAESPPQSKRPYAQP